MKMSPIFRSPVTSIYCTSAAALVLALQSGCDSFQSYPGKAGVERWVGPGCTVVSVQKMQRLYSGQDGMQGLKRVAYPYEADCVPAGGSTPRRVTGFMVFEQRHEWFFTVWGGGERKQDLNREPTPLAKSGATVEGGGAVSNPSAAERVTLRTPDCDAYVERVVAEVLPCLQEQRPDLMASIQMQLDEHRSRSSDTFPTIDRAVMEIAREAQCLAHWRQVNHWLPSGTAPGACGLKD